jgi:rhodanese-related sulfurtransferase
MDDAMPHTLVDVRTSEEFSGGYIPGAININLQELQQKLSRIPTDKPVIVYCRSGNRSAFAANILKQAGYTEVYDLGGIIDWARQGLPITR